MLFEEPLPFHYETLDVLVDGASASPGGNGQYSRNEPLSPDLRQPDCRHTCAALCHFDLNLSVSRLARARLVNWLWSSGMLSKVRTIERRRQREPAFAACAGGGEEREHGILPRGYGGWGRLQSADSWEQDHQKRMLSKYDITASSANLVRKFCKN
jgi:hypothetical protein